MNKLLTAGALVALSASQALAAPPSQAWPKWYVGLSGGLSYLQESDISGSSTGDLEYDPGFSGSIALGYNGYSGGMGGLRTELELGYRYAGLDKTVIGGTSTAAPGHAQALSYMVNIYYDFRNASRWTPYIGGGAGGAQIDVSQNAALGMVDDHDSVFAYQGMAGISYAPASMPMTEWSLGYRYFVLDSPSFNTTGGKIELDDVASHTAEIGGRFRF